MRSGGCTTPLLHSLTCIYTCTCGRVHGRICPRGAAYVHEGIRPGAGPQSNLRDVMREVRGSKAGSAPRTPKDDKGVLRREARGAATGRICCQEPSGSGQCMHTLGRAAPPQTESPDNHAGSSYRVAIVCIADTCASCESCKRYPGSIAALPGGSGSTRGNKLLHDRVACHRQVGMHIMTTFGKDDRKALRALFAVIKWPQHVHCPRLKHCVYA